jgi:hypothetical protein
VTRGTTIPAVLAVGPDTISTERALNQVKELLDLLEEQTTDEHTIDRLHASLDDVDTMLRAVQR